MSFEVTITDAALYEDRLWFSNASFNGLFSMNPDTFEIRFEAFFLGEDLMKRLIHKWVFSYCDKLYFIPFTGQVIHVFNGDEITSIPVEKKNKNSYYMFSDAVFSEEEKRIYLMPMDNESDLQYLELQSNCIYDLPSFKQHISKLDSNIDAEMQVTCTYLLNGELCFLYGYKWFVRWDIKKEFMDVYKVAPKRDNMVWHLFSDEKRFWLYFQSGDLAIFDETDYSIAGIQFNTTLKNEHSLLCMSEQGGDKWFISDGAEVLFKCKENGEFVEKIYLEAVL